jgi:hypothetical protein
VTETARYTPFSILHHFLLNLGAQVNRISLDVCSQQPGALTTTIKGAGHQGILFNKDGIQAVVDAVISAKP